MKTIQQIKKTPLAKRTVEEEYLLAKHEKRAPRCIYCHEVLEITQMRDVNVSWVWDEKTQSYVKDDEDTGTSYEPCCKRCGAEDWNFADLLFGPEAQR